jgi:zinc transporter
MGGRWFKGYSSTARRRRMGTRMKGKPVSHTRDTEDDIFARYALGPGQGLVFAYGLAPDARPRELTVPAAEDMLASGHGLVWLHLDLTTTPAKRWIETRSWLPEDAREMLLTREEHTQYRLQEDGLTGILKDFHRELEEVDWRVGQLHFYADRRRLITARRHPLAALNHARQSLLRGTAEADSGIALLGLVIEALADVLDDASDTLGREIERVEDYMEREEAQHLRVAVGEARKRAILFHRQIYSERRLMARLSTKPPAWFAESDTTRLRDVIDHLSATADMLDTIEVRAKLLQDELAARLAEAANRNLFFLSVVSAIMLPMTLLAGIFGMNFTGIPAAESPFGFWIGTGIVFAVGFVALILMRIGKMM